jgi:hypothetical protein
MPCSYLLQPIWLYRIGAAHWARSFLPRYPNKRKQSRAMWTHPWHTSLDSPSPNYDPSLRCAPWHQGRNHPSDHRRSNPLPYHKVSLLTKQIRIKRPRHSRRSTEESPHRSPSHIVNRPRRRPRQFQPIPAPALCHIPRHSGFQPARVQLSPTPLSFPHFRWLGPSNGKQSRRRQQPSPGNKRGCLQLAKFTENWDGASKKVQRIHLK